MANARTERERDEDCYGRTHLFLANVCNRQVAAPHLQVFARHGGGDGVDGRPGQTGAPGPGFRQLGCVTWQTASRAGTSAWRTTDGQGAFGHRFGEDHSFQTLPQGSAELHLEPGAAVSDTT